MIAAVVQQRELFVSMLRREVRQRYKGSVLGILWSLVTPLVMMVAYTLVFSLIFTTVPFAHYPAFLLTGLSVWVFFAGGLGGRHGEHRRERQPGEEGRVRALDRARSRPP